MACPHNEFGNKSGSSDHRTSHIQDIKRLLSSITEQLNRIHQKPTDSQLHAAIVISIGGVALLLHGILFYSCCVISAIFHSVALASTAESEPVDLTLDVPAVSESPKEELVTNSLSPPSPNSEVPKGFSDTSHQLGFNTPRSQTSPTLDLVLHKKLPSRDDVISFKTAKLAREGRGEEHLIRAVIRRDFRAAKELLEAGVYPNFIGPAGRAPVHEAAIAGSTSFISALRKHAVNLVFTCKDGRTALEYAVISKRDAVVAYLLPFEGDGTFEIKEGNTTFSRMIEAANSCGSYAIVAMLENHRRERERRRQLKERKAKEIEFISAVSQSDIRQVNKLLGEGISEETALAKAIEAKSETVFAILFSSMDDGYCYDLDSAVDAACLGTDFKILKLLIDKYASPEKAAQYAMIKLIENDQRSLLVLLRDTYEVDRKIYLEKAAWKKNFYIVHELIMNGFGGLISSDAINSAFHLACTPDWPGKEWPGKEWLESELLGNEWPGKEWLENVEDARCLPVAQYLLAKGANPNSLVSIWGNYFQRAAANGHHQLIDLLIQYGGNLNASGDFGGQTALMVAVSARRWRTVLFLLDRGARLTGKESGFYGNILQTASFFGSKEIVEELLRRGVDINERVDPWGSPLLLALQGGHQDIAELFISVGADLSFSCQIYGTALHYTALLGMERMAKLLVEAGADVNAGGGEYGSALQASVIKGHSMIALFLLDNGADVNKQGGLHENALNAAEETNQLLLKKLLLFSGAEFPRRPESLSDDDIDSDGDT